MSTQGYKKLAQGPDHDLSLETEQDEQPNEYKHGAERTACSTDSTNPFDGQSDPSTITNADPTTTTTNSKSGFISSLEIDLGEPLVFDTPMDRFRQTLFGKKKTLFVGCAAVLLGIVMLSLTLMAFNRHQPITHIPRETLAYLVQSRLSSISFDSPTSPESKALDWMVNVDEFNQTAVSDDRLVQRFAMMAMVYSIDLGWEFDTLTAESVCMWVDGDYVVFSCNKDDMVDAIYSDVYHPENSFLPVAVGLLTGLTTLELPENNLTSTIPAEMGLLRGLGGLTLDHNQFTGTIPTEIGQLTGLAHLNLGANDLTGSIPTEIGLLIGITRLDLTGNQITGTIPTEIGLLTSLTDMDISYNDLTGTIPSEIGLLTSLKYLYLHDNTLTGSIPTEIGLLTSLTILHLYSNTLTGSTPTRLCGHPHNFFFIDCDKIACSCCKDIEGHHCPTN